MQRQPRTSTLRTASRRGTIILLTTLALLLGTVLAPDPSARWPGADVASAAPGDLDPSFGGLGYRIQDMAGMAPYGLIERVGSPGDASDDRYVVLGAASNGDQVAAVMQLHTDGTPDTSFGIGGIANPDFGAGTSRFDTAAIQPDGKIVAVGATFRPDTAGRLDWLLARFDTDGSLDPSFGTGGFVHQELPSCCSEARGVHVLSSGKILVAGGDSPNFYVARYNADGSLDTGFGVGDGNNISPTDGLVRTAIASLTSVYAMVVSDDESEIYAVGSVNEAVTGGSAVIDALVVRYDEDGYLDTTYGGGDGYVRISLSGDAYGYGAALQADGDLVVAGINRHSSTHQEAFAARLNGDGSADTAFADGNAADISGTGDGIWLYDPEDDGAGRSEFNTVAIQPADQKILIVGDTGSCSCVIASRLNTDGSLDTSFQDDVTDNTGITPPQGIVASLNHDAVGFIGSASAALLSTGKVLAVGDNSGSDFLALVRLDADGGADTTFDLLDDATSLGNGWVTQAFSKTANVRGLAIDARGEVYLGGDGWISGDSRMTLLKVSCDASVPGSGFSDRVRTSFDIPGGTEAIAALAFQSDGRLVMVGTQNPYDDPSGFGDFAVARFDPNRFPRVLDASFGSGGAITTDLGAHDLVEGVAIQDDDKIVVVGSSGSGPGRDIAVLRYLADGSALDTSFDGDGIAKYDLSGSPAAATDVAIQPDGKIVVAGYGTPAGGDLDVVALRLNPDGSLDSSFGSGGIAVHDLGGPDERAFAMALTFDGKIALAGDMTPDAGDPFELGRNVLVARLLSDGSLDAGFSGDGWRQEDVLGIDDGTDIDVMPDGRIAVSARTIATVANGGTPGNDFVVYRFLPDGSLDTGFSDDGLARADLGGGGDTSWAMAVGIDGAVIAAGQTFDFGDNENRFAVARFQGDPLVAQKAEDDKVYGIDGRVHLNPGTTGLATLVEIDPTTGEAEAVGPTCIKHISAMAVGPDGTIYATDAGLPVTPTSTLYTLDAATGTPTNIGTIGLNNLTGLTFHPAGDMYALVSPASGTTEQAIYTVDTNDATPTKVADLSENVHSLAFAEDGTAYVVYNVASDTDHFGTVDLGTGTVTDLGDTNSYNISEISIAEDGTIYAVDPTNREYLELDPLTGNATVVGSFGAGFDSLLSVDVAIVRDRDGDGVFDEDDNCPLDANGAQTDTDGDGAGDACDADDDDDGVSDEDEDALGTDPLVVDTDGDTLTDGAEVNLYGTDPLVAGGDSDGDGLLDLDEIFVLGTKPGLADSDGDGHDDASDNCPVTANADQADADADGQGDVCDAGEAMYTVALPSCAYPGGVSELREIDPLTGATTAIGSMGADNVIGLAIAPDGTMYAASPGPGFAGSASTLYTVDVTTGALTEIGDMGLQYLRSIKFAPDGTLYALVYALGNDCSVNELRVVDRSTGTSSLVATLSDSADGLAFHPDGTLYTMVGCFLGTELGTIDLTTGDVTAIGPVGGGATVNGLTWTQDGGLLYGHDVANDVLLRIDETTGAGTAIGPLGVDCLTDLDTIGLADQDGDGVFDIDDNCPLTANASQTDTDGDGAGNACDADDDGDGYDDVDDAFPLDASEWVDTDGDGTGDNADLDDDGDGQTDVHESACGSDPLDAASTSPDADADGIPDCVEPSIVEITTVVDPVSVGTEVSVSATFADGDDDDDHSASIDWGDGATLFADVDQSANTISDEHTYTEPGVYTLTVTVTDGDDNEGTRLHQYVVVYDPDGGFVTGGGWIDSPEGAYLPDPDLTGKATFGFVAKYQQGQSSPDGKTEFHFKAAGLKFKSSDYEWLVIMSGSGHKAMFQGEGKINNAGHYGFKVTGIDAANTPSTDDDLFRMKIWDKDDNDTVVYDNQIACGDEEDPNADPCTALGGGNIKIHKD